MLVKRYNKRILAQTGKAAISLFLVLVFVCSFSMNIFAEAAVPADPESTAGSEAAAYETEETSIGEPSATPIEEPTATATGTPSATATGTPSATATGTPSATATGTPSATATASAEPSATPAPTLASLQTMLDAMPDAMEPEFVVTDENFQELEKQLKEWDEAEEAFTGAGGDISELDTAKAETLRAALEAYQPEDFDEETEIALMALAPQTDDTDWIAQANDSIAAMPSSDWTTHLSEEFYKLVPFAADDTGTLNWAVPGLPEEQVWNGLVETDLTPNTTGTLADKQAAAAAEGDVAPAFETDTYYVYSPQQLLYALRDIYSHAYVDYTISIERDLDMAGDVGYRWPDNLILVTKTTILGNGHTIYNLCVKDEGDAVTDGSGTIYRASGLLRMARALKASDLTFRNAYISGYVQAGVLAGYMHPLNAEDSQFMEMRNISIQDSLIISYKVDGSAVQSNGAGALFGRRQIDSFAYIGGSITNCNVQNCIVAGRNHTGAMTSALNDVDLVSYCFATKCTVISFGEHSGGLFSCISGATEISNCFVDANVYCNKQGGVFAGAIGNAHIYSCATSGFVEGGDTSLGGFVGITESGRRCTIVDCYSTALVGMRSTAKEIGGFVGTVVSSPGYNTGFVNCYAAGEVGYAKTDSSSGAVGSAQADLTGGFVGDYNAAYSRNIMAYCFYDKQTTAMQEWDDGNKKQSYPISTNVSNPGLLTDYVDTTDLGLRGVLTTDTDKAAFGLTSQKPEPGATGFTGFKNMTAVYGITQAINILKQDIAKTAVAYSGWDYSAEDHYPELAAFRNAGAEWGQWADLVKAYSYSSTATVLLETWENQLDRETGEVDVKVNTATVNPATGVPFTAAEVSQWNTVYDTVRDITSRFTFSSDASIQSWTKTETQIGDGSSYAVSAVTGGEVFSLFQITGVYTGDYFAPGLEWVHVTTNSGNPTGTAVGSRRFRLMPTCGIQAGETAEIIGTDPYDHADDVELYFSTRARLDADPMDVTLGIFPDCDTGGANALTQKQKDLSAKSSPAMNSEAEMDAYFAANGNDTFSGVSANHLSEDAADNANGSKIYTYAYPIKAYDPPSGRVIYDAEEEGIKFTEQAEQDQFNGYTQFSSNVNGNYLMQYTWQLKDGRCVTDGKILCVKAIPFAVSIAAQNADGSENEDDVSLDITNLTDNDIPGPDDYSGISTTDTTKMLEEDVDYTDKVVTGWKLQNDMKWVQSVSVRFESNMGKPVYVTAADGTQIACGTNSEVLTYDADGNPLYDIITDGGTTFYVPVGSTGVKRDDNGSPYYEQKRDADNKPIYDNYYFEVTADNPAERYKAANLPATDPDYRAGADKLTVPYTMYHFIQAVNGDYYVTYEIVDRVYQILYHEDTDTYYLAFDKDNEEKLTSLNVSVKLMDVADNIDVLVKLDKSLSIMKELQGAYADRTASYNFFVNVGATEAAPAGTPLTAAIYTYVDGKIGDTLVRNVTGMETGQTGVFTLMDGQYLRISNLPEGCTYQAGELCADLYDISAYDYHSGVLMAMSHDTVEIGDSSGEYETVSGTLPENGKTIVYRNSRTPVIPSGIQNSASAYPAMVVAAVSGLLLLALIVWGRRRKYRHP